MLYFHTTEGGGYTTHVTHPHSIVPRSVVMQKTFGGRGANFQSALKNQEALSQNQKLLQKIQTLKWAMNPLASPWIDTPAGPM